jgi:hypothetical protein
MELVVSIPQLESGTPFNGLAEKLSELRSMKVEGFCNSKKLLYIAFNADQYYNVMLSLNETGYAYFISKESIRSSIAECSAQNELYVLQAPLPAR